MKIARPGENPSLDAIAAVIQKQLAGIEGQLPAKVEAIDLATTLASGCAGYLAYLVYEYRSPAQEPGVVATACGAAFARAFAQAFPLYVATEEARIGAKQ